MKYFVIRKIELYVFAFFLIALVSLGVLGVHQTKLATANATKAHPIYCVELNAGENKIAYGINCAWGAGDIPQLLDELDRLEVKVTFFVVGDWCEKNPEAVLEMFTRGHEIANHSNTHKDMATLTQDQMIAEIELCSEKIFAITGHQPDLFRAPSGSYNTTVINTAKELEYYPIQWDCDSLDWRGYTPQKMLQRIEKTLKPGSILLFHNDTPYTITAIPALVEKMQQDGYQIVPVGELIHRGAYTVDHTGKQHSSSIQQ